MATPEQRIEKITEAKKLLDELAEIKASSLARTEELSRDINFSDAVPSFEEMLDIVKQLNQWWGEWGQIFILELYLIL
jgi:hypothetical protein